MTVALMTNTTASSNYNSVPSLNTSNVNSICTFLMNWTDPFSVPQMENFSAHNSTHQFFIINTTVQIIHRRQMEVSTRLYLQWQLPDVMYL